jgi:hypothetical protein
MCHSHMHCFHTSIIHFLWSLYITNINNFPATIVFVHLSLIFCGPSEAVDRGFTVFTLILNYVNRVMVFEDFNLESNLNI